MSPFEGEHSCRLRDPGEFQDDSFGRSTRDHEGKEYDVVQGKLEGDDAMTDQSFRYKTETWTSAEARQHCEDHDGEFHAAAAGEGAEVHIPPADCAAQHFGPWLVHVGRFEYQLAAIRSGVQQPRSAAETARRAERPPYEINKYGIATLFIQGMMTKGDSSYGDVSTARVRKALVEAARDEKAKAIMLIIDSPGGTVDGTDTLARSVARANERKPVYVYAEDMCASAAYWVASQAGRISANPTAQIGSIGIVTVVEDTSGHYEAEGIKVHVISTGPYKGAFVPGAPVSKEHLAYAQELTDGYQKHFAAAVMTGRSMKPAAFKRVSDGRTWLADEAKELGLIDEVEDLNTAYGQVIADLDLFTEDQAPAQPRLRRAKARLRLAELSSELGPAAEG